MEIYGLLAHRFHEPEQEVAVFVGAFVAADEALAEVPVGGVQYAHGAELIPKVPRRRGKQKAPASGAGALNSPALLTSSQPR